MAFVHGKGGGSLVVNAGTLTSFLNDTSMSMTADTGETTVFGLASKTYIAGLRDATVSFSGLYDPTATTGPVAILEAAMAGAVPVNCVYKPGGTASGQNSFTFSGIVTGYDISAGIGDVVALSGEIQATGAITVAVI